jgi:hypothetical protein
MDKKMKIGRMPTAEIVVWCGPPKLEPRKRRAIIDALIAQEDREEKFGLIERILGTIGLTPLDFAELCLEVLEDRMGVRSTKYQRIEDERRRA